MIESKILIAYILYLQSWLKPDEDLDDLSDEFFHSLREKWEKEWLPAINSEHSGDCTQQPWSCMRCWWDRVLKLGDRLAF
jgi:hypothetical protein